MLVASLRMGRVVRVMTPGSFTWASAGPRTAGTLLVTSLR